MGREEERAGKFVLIVGLDKIVRYIFVICCQKIF
jgi:hypothetical protein